MALIYLCLHRSVQEINRHFWQIIKRLDEMIGRFFPLAGIAETQPRASAGAGRGMQEEKAEHPRGQAGGPGAPAPRAGFREALGREPGKGKPTPPRSGERRWVRF